MENLNKNLEFVFDLLAEESENQIDSKISESGYPYFAVSSFRIIPVRVLLISPLSTDFFKFFKSLRNPKSTLTSEKEKN